MASMSDPPLQKKTKKEKKKEKKAAEAAAAGKPLPPAPIAGKKRFRDEGSKNAKPQGAKHARPDPEAQAAAVVEATAGRRVFVGHVKQSVDEATIRELFQKCGPIREVDMMRRTNGR